MKTTTHSRKGEETVAGLVLKPARLFPPTNFEEGLGCAGYTGAPKTVEEMKEGMDEALQREWTNGFSENQGVVL